MKAVHYFSMKLLGTDERKAHSLEHKAVRSNIRRVHLKQ